MRTMKSNILHHISFYKRYLSANSCFLTEGSGVDLVEVAYIAFDVKTVPMHKWIHSPVKSGNR